MYTIILPQLVELILNCHLHYFSKTYGVGRGIFGYIANNPKNKIF